MCFIISEKKYCINRVLFTYLSQSFSRHHTCHDLDVLCERTYATATGWLLTTKKNVREKAARNLFYLMLNFQAIDDRRALYMHV